MKLQKIAKLCKDAKQIVVLNHIDGNGEIRRYIGDGTGLYEVPGLGDQIKDETLYTVFDIPASERQKYKISTIDGTGKNWFEDVMQEDSPASDAGISISYRGSCAVPFYNENGEVLLIAPEYLAPFQNEEKNALRLFTREGLHGIIVCRGLFENIAVIAALQSDTEFDNAFITLGDRMRRKLTEGAQ